MKNALSILFLLFSLLTFSQNKEIGQNFVETLLKEKNFEKAITFLDVSIKDKITIDLLSKTSTQLDAQLGAYQNIISVVSKSDVFLYYTQFKNVALDFEIKFKEDKIIGFFLKQHKEENPDDYNIKSGTIDLKGTLLLPDSSNLLSVNVLVVFVHGSGPNDRDETFGPNKPFRDIAEGLKNVGIASYRFDKRTFSNPETFSDESTVEDEVVTDVVAVVNHFKTSEKFKNYKIVVLGHSLGAHLLPKIANSVTFDKGIMLAGNVRGLHELIVEQVDYLNKLNPSSESEKQAVEMREKVQFLTSKEFNLSAKKEQLPLGLSAKYWQSCLNYKPLVEVKKVKMPLLILNGERDYQVTMKEFNLWKKNIKNKKSRFISYSKLNHLFMVGEGDPNPTEYSVQGEVDDSVIVDIVSFCKS